MPESGTNGAAGRKMGHPPAREQGKEEERFLSAQADAFVPAKRAGRKNRAGAKAEEKIGLLRWE